MTEVNPRADRAVGIAPVFPQRREVLCCLYVVTPGCSLLLFTPQTNTSRINLPVFNPVPTPVVPPAVSEKRKRRDV
jgi:hypothetical protein